MGGSWVLVASPQRARLLESETPRAELREIGDLVVPREFAEPRAFAVGGAAVSPVRRQSADPDDAAAMEFVQDICDALGQARRAGRFDRLYVVAAPRFIGALRRGLSIPVRRCLAGELPLDLTDESVAEIRSYLPELL